MARIWSDENRFRTWLAVEVAATETLAEAGLVPKDAAKAIRERADFRVDRIHEIEAEVRHDVIAAAEDMRVGKFSGAVGIFAHLTPELEEKICARLGLKAAAVSSQVIQRDRHAHYLSTLAVIASTLDKIATEIRHLQRTEVREAEEYFSEKQKGSSAMPHKRNPVTSEQISGLARVVRANAQAGFENVALWHERDISHSSVERVILPDSTTLVDYLLNKTANQIDTMLV